jgi:4-hydroxy 2-oxovalerate aldolase
MNHIPAILECTLRDGSYAVDFQFNAEDTRRIAARLDKVGFPLIEVGHGAGLGASERGMGHAAASDEEYMEAASAAVRRGQWGMFCIPGIAELTALDRCAEHHMGFVRIGTEVTEAESTREYIERARERGIFVFANLLKSYATAPEHFACQAQKCVVRCSVHIHRGQRRWYVAGGHRPLH